MGSSVTWILNGIKAPVAHVAGSHHHKAAPYFFGHGQDGLHLLAQVKQVAPQVPVVLITGWGSIGLAVEGMKAGAAEFVTKPWHNEALLQTIHTVLSLSAGPGETAAAPEPESAATSRRQLDKQYRFADIIGVTTYLYC